MAAIEPEGVLQVVQTLARGLQELIAGGMAEGVVDRFEEIQIAKQDAQFLAGALDLAVEDGDAVHDLTTVQEFRELVGAGALGNVIDRILYGAVADFLNMSLPNWQNPYSFNVADISIFAGAIGLVLIPQKTPEPPKPVRKPRATPAAPPRAPEQARLPLEEPGDGPRDGSGKSG